jgi:hypothetical protein
MLIRSKLKDGTVIAPSPVVRIVKLSGLLVTDRKAGLQRGLMVIAIGDFHAIALTWRAGIAYSSGFARRSIDIEEWHGCN